MKAVTRLLSCPAIWGPWRTVSEVVSAPGGIGQVRREQVLDRAGAFAGAGMKAVTRLLSYPAIWGPWRTVSEVVTAPGGIGQVRTEQVLDALARLRVPA